jgi:hypothetical protein
VLWNLEFVILEKATDTKVHTGVEIVKCIAFLHNSITDGEGLSEFSSNDCGSLDATGGTQFNNSRMHNSVTDSAKLPRGLFCEFFHIPPGSVPRHEQANRDVQ